MNPYRISAPRPPEKPFVPRPIWPGLIVGFLVALPVAPLVPILILTPLLWAQDVPDVLGVGVGYITYAVIFKGPMRSRSIGQPLY